MIDLLVQVTNLQFRLEVYLIIAHRVQTVAGFLGFWLIMITGA
jgi:hypothetical protein